MEVRQPDSRAAMTGRVRMLFRSIGKCEAVGVDLYETGMYVVCGHDIPAGENCMLAFELVTQFGEARINAWGVVVRTSLDNDGRTRAELQFLDMDAGSRMGIRFYQTCCAGGYQDPAARA